MKISQTAVGKNVRLNRIFNNRSKKTIIVPIDHAVTIGPIEGLTNIKELMGKFTEGGANTIVMHKGLLRYSCFEHGNSLPVLLHLSASTALSPFPDSKILIGSVEEAIRLGADGVSIHLNIGDSSEGNMLKEVGEVITLAERWGIPVLAMVYGRGPKIKNPYSPDTIGHCARLADELGADIVKVNYTGEIDSFKRVVDACRIPVVIAGGPKLDSYRDILCMTHDSIKAGGAGISLGRNVFQANNPIKMLRALSGIVHQKWSVEDAVFNMEEPVEV